MTMPDFYSFPKSYRAEIIQKFVKRYNILTTMIPLYLIIVYSVFISLAFFSYHVSAFAHLINLILGALCGFYWLMPTPIQYFRCAVQLHQIRLRVLFHVYIGGNDSLEIILL